MISVYGGTGFIGSRFCNIYPSETLIISREENEPQSNDILYFISTTDNYNVYNNPTLDIETNLIKLVRVLEKCREQNGQVFFNFVSSWFCYGEVDLPAKEEAICNPKGLYSITKRAAEQILISYCNTFSMKYRIFRLSNVIGETDRGVSKKKNALQYLIEEIKENRDINLYYGGNFIRDYMYVDDICYGIYLSMFKAPANSIINIGSGNPYKFLDLMSYCRNKLNSTSNFISIEPTEFHKVVQVKDMYLDTTKLKNLGFVPRYSIYEALDKLLCPK